MLVTARTPALQVPEPLKYPSQLLNEIEFTPSSANKPQVSAVPSPETRSEEPTTLDQAFAAAMTVFETCAGAPSVLTLKLTVCPSSGSNQRIGGFQKWNCASSSPL